MDVLIIAGNGNTDEKIEEAIRTEYVRRFPDILGAAENLHFVWAKIAADAIILLNRSDNTSLKIETVVIETSMIPEVGVDILRAIGKKGKNIIPATIIGSIPEDQYLNLSAGAGSRFIQY